MSYCKHERCRLDTIAELGWLAPLMSGEMYERAISEVRTGEVHCRIVPRDGAVKAPFPSC